MWEQLRAEDDPIDLPVYDAYGTKLAFTVQSLMPVKARSTKDIPLKYFGTYGIGKSKSSIIFDKLWLGTDGFRVTLVGAKPGEQKRPIEIKVPLGECRYRQSTVVGNRDSGFDVSHTTAFGKVEGCKLEGDWWVRAVSIFGGGEYMPGFEGFVDRETGDIVIAGILRGNRHLVVLGRGASLA